MASPGRESRDERVRVLRSEAVLIAAAPVVAYIYVYCYDAAYLSTFSVPLDFISIDPISTLTLGAAMFFFVLPGVIAGVTQSRRRQVSRIGESPRGFLKFIRTSFIVSSYASFLAVSYWMMDEDRARVFVVLVFALLLPLCFSLWRFEVRIRRARRIRRSLLNAIARNSPRIKNPWFLRAGDVDDLITRRFGVGTVGIVMLALIGVFFSSYLGMAATLKERWLVIEGPKPRLVLAKYGDDLLTVDYDRNRHQVGGKIVVYRIGKSFPELTVEDVQVTKRPGPLTQSILKMASFAEGTVKSVWLAIHH